MSLICIHIFHHISIILPTLRLQKIIQTMKHIIWDTIVPNHSQIVRSSNVSGGGS